MLILVGDGKIEGITGKKSAKGRKALGNKEETQRLARKTNKN